jgi:hypothetical protein
MHSHDDWEDEPAFVIQRVLDKLHGPDMTDLDWEVLAGEVDALSLEQSRFRVAGAKQESKFSDAERSRALKDLQAAIRNRDQKKTITEAELAFMVWGLMTDES